VKYGLFIRNTMDKGSSSATFTFGNSEGLSKKEDFTVEEVELWAVDNGYWLVYFEYAESDLIVNLLLSRIQLYDYDEWLA
jgi:hypothetical protein